MIPVDKRKTIHPFYFNKITFPCFPPQDMGSFLFFSKLLRALPGLIPEKYKLSSYRKNK
jgi:hypothetical protein